MLKVSSGLSGAFLSRGNDPRLVWGCYTCGKLGPVVNPPRVFLILTSYSEQETTQTSIRDSGEGQLCGGEKVRLLTTHRLILLKHTADL
uniref:Uncharacterized protein n=1 Tax=Stegastes partitus TaxID=144197 RepID=A0A3B5BJW7_9TELE